MRVLVLDGHSWAAIESAQSLGRAGFDMHVASSEPRSLSYSSRYLARRLTQPAVGLVEWLRALDAQHDYRLIVPTTELSLVELHRLPELDTLRRKAVLAPWTSIEIAIDKQRSTEYAAQVGFRVPASTLIHDVTEIEDQPYPLVLKPVRSKVLVDGEVVTIPAYVARNKQDARGYVRRWMPYTPLQRQSYVRGRGYGVEFLFCNGKKLWHFAHERIHELPLTGGASSYRRSAEPPADLLQKAEYLLAALRWHGVAMLEFKVDARGEFTFIEINPRLWGSLALSIDAGVDFPLGLARLSAGAVDLAQPQYRVPYYTRNIEADLEWMIANLRAEHSDPLLLTDSTPKSVVQYLRPLMGAESWDHVDVHDLRVAYRIVHRILRRLWTAIRNHREARKRDSGILQRHTSVLDHSAARLRAGYGLLFVCHGNICRSPVAHKLALQSGAVVPVCSAGFHRIEGRRSPDHVQKLAREIGVDLGEWRSTRLTREMIDAAGLIVVMDRENYEALIHEFPEALERTTALGAFLQRPTANIADPSQMADESVRTVLLQLRGSVQQLGKWLQAVTGDARGRLFRRS